MAVSTKHARLFGVDCRQVGPQENAPDIPRRLLATLRSVVPSIEVALDAIPDCESKWAGKLHFGYCLKSALTGNRGKRRDARF